MKGYELSPEAKNDLQEIWSFIAANNIAAADKLEADIYDACEALADNPRLGHKRPDLTSRPLRFALVRDYLIAYSPEEGHGRRNPRIMAAILRDRV